MKNILKILLYLLLSINFLSATTICTSNYSCIIKGDVDEGYSRDLTCRLPAIPTLKIKAKNVLDKEGNLTTYWDGKTVCDVLDWMNTAVEHIAPNYNGLSTTFTQTMDLELKSLQRNIGGMAFKTALKFDSDRPYLFGDDGTSNFHWLRMHFIVVHEFSHFIEKNSQPKTNSGIPDWVEEGRAKDFEDIVYDSQNPYSDVFTSYKMYEQKIANVLNDKGLTKYDYPNFVFFKALRNKCGHIEMGLLTNDKPDLKQATDGCTGIPNVGGDDLAGLFTLYNWAMLYKQDLSLLDANEPARPNDEIFDGEYKEIDKAGFTEPIDITEKIGTSLAPFSAKSFLITHETLTSDADMNLTFKSNGDLKLIAVRVKGDGSSDVNDNFVMKSNDTAYELTALDKAGGLFVTIVNTTDKEINIEKLILKKQSKTTANLAFHYVYNCAGEVAGLKLKIYTTNNGASKLIHTEDFNNFYTENRIPDNSWIIKDGHLFKDANLYGNLGNDTIGGWQAKVLHEVANKNEIETLINNSWNPEIYRYIEVDRSAGGIGQGGHMIGIGWGNNGDNCSLPVISYKVQTVRMATISIEQTVIDKILEEF
jgi:hypothetical protein